MKESEARHILERVERCDIREEEALEALKPSGGWDPEEPEPLPGILWLSPRTAEVPVASLSPGWFVRDIGGGPAPLLIFRHPVWPEKDEAAARLIKAMVAAYNRERDHEEIEAEAREEGMSAGRLTLADAIQIARGCLDYGGGYRSSDRDLEIFHHGIQTVCNALTAAKEQGLGDTQVEALHSMGKAAQAEQAALPAYTYREQDGAVRTVREFQDAIHAHLVKLSGCQEINGAGSDGDEIEFTLSEISQAWASREDQAVAETLAQAEQSERLRCLSILDWLLASFPSGWDYARRMTQAAAEKVKSGALLGARETAIQREVAGVQESAGDDPRERLMQNIREERDAFVRMVESTAARLKNSAIATSPIGRELLAILGEKEPPEWINGKPQDPDRFTPEPVQLCEWPGCSLVALCRSGNFQDRFVCARHFHITNGAPAPFAWTGADDLPNPEPAEEAAPQGFPLRLAEDPVTFRLAYRILTGDGNDDLPNPHRWGQEPRLKQALETERAIRERLLGERDRARARELAVREERDGAERCIGDAVSFMRKTWHLSTSDTGEGGVPQIRSLYLMLTGKEG